MKTYLVNNGGEYDDYAIIGVFSTRELAQELADEAGGEIEEWQTDVPRENWTTWTASARLRYESGQWTKKDWREQPESIYSRKNPPFAETHTHKATALLGHYSGWDEVDPALGRYTEAAIGATGSTEEEARRLVREKIEWVLAEYP